MEQFEQLLTCCVCLDRYRIPKLLPCQHSFCMEPCMEGLVDYVRRQVKCPECRAEHRIPYNGVQAFPTNVTLQRFLELHIEITGELPDPTSGQIMERCSVCSEKAYLSHCAHCEKKICEDCKSAHMDILRREITRFNSQIRRSLHRLQDSLSLIEKNMISLQTNCVSVTEEVDEIYRRVTKAIKDRSDQLKGEVDRYLTVELSNLTRLKENLDLEVTNIQGNCDIVDKYMNDTVEWDDAELMDTKEIFLKTVEFLRHFEYENSDYSRRVRFLVSIDPNQLVMNLTTFGDLNITPHSTPGGSLSTSHLAPSSALQPGLMRSKSDHRLATQFRQQEERGGYNDEPVLGGRKFGERPVRVNNDRYGDSSRYGGREYDYENEYENEQPSRTPKSRFRSRFVRSHQNEDSDTEQQIQQRQEADKRKDRVLDGEDVSRGQLSGIIRLSDCARVIQRLADIGKEKKEKKVDTAAQAAVQAAIQAQKASMQRPKQTAAQRQVSEDDEISRIKTQNKNAPGSSTAAANNARVGAVAESDRPPVKRGGAEDSDNSNHASSVRRTPSRAENASATEETCVLSDETPTPTPTQQSKPPVAAPVAAVKTRAGSTESSASTESSGSTAPTTTAAAASATSAASAATNNRRFSTTRESPARTRAPSTASAAPSTTATEKKPFVSRFLPQHATNATNGSDNKKPESESSSEEETSTEESEDEVATKPAKLTSTTSSAKPSSNTTNFVPSSVSSGTPSTYRERLENRRNSRDDVGARTSTTNYSTPSNTSSGYANSAATRTRPTTASHHVDNDDRYSGASGSSYTSRFLNKSKSSAIVAQPTLTTPNASFDDDAEDSDSRYGTGRSRYLAMKERRNRLARSRSTHTLGNDDEELDEPVSPTTASPNAYLASRYSGYAGSDLSRSRSSHALKSRDNSPITERNTTRGAHTSSALSNNTDNKDGEALSSWARYLKNKYGNKTAKDAPSSSSVSHTSHSSALPSTSLHGSAGRSSASDVSRRLSLGLPLRQANELASSDDDASKNALGSPTSPTVAAGITGIAGTTPKQLYLRKRQQLFQLGGRGSEPGSFTWPRGLAVGPDNSIVVADSSNHRVQVFDSNGIFVKEFGEYGSGEGEFDCLAGVAVNRIGQYIIADRYNHRIQILDPQGRFLRAFGSQGTADGKFNYPWGVTTDVLGFIYICDKENHRVQVFQSDGTFVGKFGTCGRGEGQLEHPHYIAVSNTNRVIVSDSNNHRIQIFDVNGKVISVFGGEGSDDGQFKFPRGVAVDEQGYIFVADSGNNRIQIFNPDGTHLKTFGSWGSGDSEFKGLEGVAIMSNGNILVCDRENHRIQVF